MKRQLFGLALAMGALAALPAQGALVISEVLFNEVGSDVNGEWVEIHNTGPGVVDLSNFKIGDEETSGGTGATEAMHSFPAGASIGAGVTQIVAVQALRFQTVYGFLPTYEIVASDAGVPDMGGYATWDPDGGVLNMGNGGDHLIILDGADALVDAVNWDNNTFLNPGIVSAEADGQSYERINVNIDTDTAGDWRLGNPSSPGVANIPEPASLVLLGIGLAAGACVRRRR
jgi:hypothetical protein